jgi:hypothetical protein
VSCSAVWFQVSGPSASITAAVASVLTRSFVASVRTDDSGIEPITSGRSPAAAAAVRVWLNWSSSTPTSSTRTPVCWVNRSMIAWVAATRSGSVSAVQTVIAFASPPSSPPPPPQAATAMTATSPMASPTRRVTVLITTCSPIGCCIGALQRLASEPLGRLIHNRCAGLFLPDAHS